jgi:hypothetical protein
MFPKKTFKSGATRGPSALESRSVGVAPQLASGLLADVFANCSQAVPQKIQEQLGNKCCQKPSKTVYHDIGKGKKRQPRSILKIHLQAGGRRFDPGHVHQTSSQC